VRPGVREATLRRLAAVAKRPVLSFVVPAASSGSRNTPSRVSLPSAWRSAELTAIATARSRLAVRQAAHRDRDRAGRACGPLRSSPRSRPRRSRLRSAAQLTAIATAPVAPKQIAPSRR